MSWIKLITFCFATVHFLFIRTRKQYHFKTKKSELNDMRSISGKNTFRVIQFEERTTKGCCVRMRVNTFDTQWSDCVPEIPVHAHDQKKNTYRIVDHISPWSSSSVSTSLAVGLLQCVLPCRGVLWSLQALWAFSWALWHWLDLLLKPLPAVHLSDH